MNKILTLIFCVGCLLAASCDKHIDEINSPNSQIGFFNASEYVQAQLLNTGGQSTILMDAPDTTSPVTGPTLAAPVFSNAEYLYQYPNQFYYGSQSQPWISYLQTYPATHTITLTDTGAHHALITSRVETAGGAPVTVYYADSLSVFRSWVLRDTVSETAGTVRLRVFDLSPDAGKVFFTIDGQPATGFPDTLRYGQITPFTAWPNAVTDTLQVRFYNAGDSVDILTSASLVASPGHAYNLVFTGYMNYQSYRDPVSNQYLNFNPDLKVLLTQNN